MKSKSQKKDWNEKDTHGWLPINCRHKAGNLRTRGFPKCPTLKKSAKQADGLVLVASPEVSYDVYYRVPLCFNLAKFGETWSDVRSETVPPRNVVVLASGSQEQKDPTLGPLPQRGVSLPEKDMALETQRRPLSEPQRVLLKPCLSMSISSIHVTTTWPAHGL